MLHRTSVSCKADLMDILPNLFSLAATARLRREGFLRILAVALWQIRLCGADALWHGGYVIAGNNVVFCSMIETANIPAMELPTAIADAFETGTVELFLGQGFWEVVVTESVQREDPPDMADHYMQAIAVAICGVLSEKATLIRQNRELIHERGATNQGVMAMREQAALAEIMVQRVHKHQPIESEHALRERLRLQEQALAQADRLAVVGELTAEVAHEINNPLAFIRVNAEFFRRAAAKMSDGDCFPAELTAETVRAADAVLRGVDRISAIMESLKYFSRRDHGEKESFALADCVNESWFLISSGKSGGEAEFCSTIPSELHIWGNRQQIEQVFVNLISNSIHAFTRTGRTGGKIWVSAELERAKPGVAVVRFCDDGGGIASEDLMRIFDPFFTTDRRRGMGLGLSIVQNIITEHGGSIVPRAENGGAAFWIRLPLAVKDKGGVAMWR